MGVNFLELTNVLLLLLLVSQLRPYTNVIKQQIKIDQFCVSASLYPVFLTFSEVAIQMFLIRASCSKASMPVSP